MYLKYDCHAVATDRSYRTYITSILFGNNIIVENNNSAREVKNHQDERYNFNKKKNFWSQYLFLSPYQR